jgi:hypothetical protein
MDMGVSPYAQKSWTADGTSLETGMDKRLRKEEQVDR